jgi:glutathione peroxidase
MDLNSIYLRKQRAKKIVIMSMKIFIPLLTLLTSCLGFNQVKSKPANLKMKNSINLYSFKMKSIDGTLIDFAIYKGKKVLIVNTASKCGFTPQYEALEALHKTYGQQLVVLGFPANNFGGQEPGSNNDIAAFCQKNYGVSFQLFEKVDVTGDKACDLFKWLANKDENGWNSQQPNWNFNKYLIDEQGELIKYFPSTTKPMSEELINSIK